MSQTHSVDDIVSVTAEGKIDGEVVELTIKGHDNKEVLIDFFNYGNRQEWDEFVEFVKRFDPEFDAEPKVEVPPTLGLGSDSIDVGTQPRFYQPANMETELQAYIDSETPIILQYTKMDGDVITRTVSPYSIEECSDYSPFSPPKYLMAWDHFKKEYRSFRLARINGIMLSVQEFVDQQ